MNKNESAKTINIHNNNKSINKDKGGTQWDFIPYFIFLTKSERFYYLLNIVMLVPN